VVLENKPTETHKRNTRRHLTEQSLFTVGVGQGVSHPGATVYSQGPRRKAETATKNGGEDLSPPTQCEADSKDNSPESSPETETQKAGPQSLL
jgi:hypothetical protein